MRIFLYFFLFLIFHSSKWNVVQFHNGGNVEISVVPMKWLAKEDGVWYCLWPNIQNNKIRKYIRKIILPKPEESCDDSWTKFQVQILLKSPVSYEIALQEEKRLEDESDNSGISSADPDKEFKGNKRKKRKNKMIGGFIETPSSSDDEVYLPNPPKLKKIVWDITDHGQAGSDDTLSFTSSKLMPPPPVPKEVAMKEKERKIDKSCCNTEGEDIPRMTSNDIDSTSDKSPEGDNAEVEKRNTNKESGENLEVDLKDKIDHILKQTIENRILLERVLNHLSNVPMSSSRNPNNTCRVDNLPKEPFVKYRDLLIYDKKIQESEECCSQLENLFNGCGGSNEKDAITRGLKYIFTDKLARKCSWLGRKNNYPCCNLKTLAVLKGAVRRSMFSSTDKSFEKIVADWLRQANLRYKRRKNQVNDSQS